MVLLAQSTTEDYIRARQARKKPRPRPRPLPPPPPHHPSVPLPRRIHAVLLIKHVYSISGSRPFTQNPITVQSLGEEEEKKSCLCKLGPHTKHPCPSPETQEPRVQLAHEKKKTKKTADEIFSRVLRNTRVAVCQFAVAGSHCAFQRVLSVIDVH